MTRPIAISPVANALSRSTLQAVASKRNHRGSAGFRPAVFKDTGKDACATGTRQCFFNLPGVGYITTPRERALTTLCRDLLRSYKTSSSKWLKTQSHALETFAGQRGYGVFFVGPSDLDVLMHYIDTKEEHHRTLSFQDEYRRFLTKHGLEYDERYVWD